ncbi:ABC-2 type transport system permease protein [Ruminococcus sp. YRD2003]|uniref:ABC transporter permease n=1 Tax=Ruminococcus sp. YRD2003 TaxID=1452313 RepID=UPI0008C7DCD0|nr:ABC-2 type transport system permease protein [Ruminococcus flavefaciens]
MQVFKLFMKILKKNIFTSMIYVIVFVSVSIPMAKSAASDRNFKDTPMTIAVFDEDDTPESRALVEFIGRKHKLKELENDKDKIMQALYFETVNYVLIINDGYSEKLAGGASDGMFSTYHIHDSYATVMVSQLLDSYVSSVRAYTAGGMDISSAQESAAEAVLTEAEVTVARSNGTENFSESTSANFRYMTYILISVIINALCPVLLKLSKKEFRFRTNCSCMKPTTYTMAVFAGSTLFIVMLWTALMVVSVIQNGGMFKGYAWFAVLNSFIYTLVCTSIALLICAFEPSDTVVNLMTQIIGLGSSFLCGVFIPQSMLGDGVLAAAKFLPAYWYVNVVEMLSGSEAFDGKRLAAYLLIECGFAAALLLIAVVVSRVKYTSTAIRLPRLAPKTQE